MITLRPLPRSKIKKVRHLTLPATQTDFVGDISDMADEPDLLQDFHTVEHTEDVVGFFKIDHDFSRKINRLPKSCLGLRGVLVGGQFQGRGFGTALFAALPAYLIDQYPATPEIWLAVDRHNHLAITLYQKHGWQHDGTAFAGRSGDEHVMRLTL